MTRTNADRAQEAQALCALMERMTGVDEINDQVSDIICHLMHLCHQAEVDGDPIDFERCLSNARINFKAEVDEETACM